MIHANKLPPLPVTHVVVDGLWEDVHGPYSAEDMRDYAQAAVLAERERWNSELWHQAQRVLIAWDGTVLPKHRDGMMQERMEDLREALGPVAAIRARGE